MRRRGKSLLALGLLSLISLAGWSGQEYFRDSKTHVQYRTAKVERGTITSYVSATGTLNPVTMVQVGTQVSGTIDKLFVDFNSAVQPGQPLAQLDQAIFGAKRVQAEANLDNAYAEIKNMLANVHNVKAAIENARAEEASKRANIERTRVVIADAQRILVQRQALFARQLLPRTDVETAQTAYDTALAQRHVAQAELQAAEAKLRSAQAQLLSAQAQVDKAQAQAQQVKAALEQARIDLERTTIRSPIRGIVISRNIDVGQTVAASLQAPTLFTIAEDLTRMQVDTNISEADIGHVAIGQTATFTVDAYPGQVMRGTVRDIRSAPVIVQNVVHYNAVLAVDNPELKLKPGMTATVSLLIAQQDNVLKIPKAALRFQPQLSAEERQELMTRMQERSPRARPDGPGAPAAAPRRSWQSLPKVWTLTPEGRLRPEVVRLGINDDQFSELQEGNVQENQELIVGLSDKESRSGKPASNSSRPPPVRF